MPRRRVGWPALVFLWNLFAISTASEANLLRNPAFQDDWATAIPRSQTLHWSYPYDYQNRRDYNPDGWVSKGSWEWRHADEPAGQRRMIVRGPSAEISQRINWIAVHDDRKLEGFPDAGEFPAFAPVRSQRPLSVVRDLLFRVRISGRAVPADAGSIVLSFGPAGQPSPGDPFGTAAEPIVSSETPLPSGDFDGRWLEAKLSAEAWQRAAEAASGRDEREGWLLPTLVRASIRYRGATGEVEIERAELADRSPAAPNLLDDGGFERPAGELAHGWSGPEKYRYFPPGHYYAFNTWHNGDFPNRGRPAIDSLITHDGRASLRMSALAGDEMAVRSDPIRMHQREARLIEVTAWVKTDRVNQLQIDALDEKGQRIDGFDFVHKALVSIGTDDWRQIRQVFRPRAPLESIRILLCVRGVNGYTLGGAGDVPQNNVAGAVWWDDVRVSEPESTPSELAERNVAVVTGAPPAPGLRLTEVDAGEALFGENVLSATLQNPGPATELGLELRVADAKGRERSFFSPLQRVEHDRSGAFRLRYPLDDSPPAYSEGRLTIRVVDARRRVIASTEIPIGGWTAPIAMELGALYLAPEQRQFVRLNLGISRATLAQAIALRLEVVRRRDGRTVRSLDVPATPRALREARDRIPSALRGDLRNLLLADLDVAGLPLEDFAAPERRWIIRATLRTRSGRALATLDSQPFCRMAHPKPQPPIEKVEIRRNTVQVNGEPWIPWGAIYGFTPHYAGPADVATENRLKLNDLPAWSYYDGYGSTPYNRRDNDLNSVREFPGYEPVTAPATRQRIEDAWAKDNLYTGTFFIVPSPGVLSPGALAEKAGGREKLDEYLEFAAKAPMIASTGPGIEENFGGFHTATSDDLAGLEQVVETLRSRTRKPVMIGHGGAWNRFEFEKVPFFDIFDPETEPLYPANLHTDLRSLVEGKEKAIWLRPQMYESVPFERWRFHTFVELMRGARGWQMAHGPADASMLRGLHAEVDSLKSIVTSDDRGPEVRTDPPIEHWSARHDGKVYVIAATTHAMAFGNWQWSEESAPPGAGRARVSVPGAMRRTESAIDSLIAPVEARWVGHGIEYFPIPRSTPPTTRLVQWVRLDPEAPPKSLAIVVKTEGRWRSFAAWGAIDLESLKRDFIFGYWFLRRFYRNAVGFVGYDGRGLPSSLAHLPDRRTIVGALPELGPWVELAVPLDRLGVTDKPVEGVGFLQDGGRIYWGETALAESDGKRDVLWTGAKSPEEETRLRALRIGVPGLAAGRRVRVLFEDREIVSSAGYFSDDFRGRDLYQRHGGALGYGDAPVAVHVYEVPSPDR